MKYNQVRHISNIDPTFDIEKMLALAPDRFLGDKRTAVQLATWDSVEAFRKEQMLRNAKMVRGRVKEGKPRPR